MRAKRSRDAQLVDKFNKQRDDLAAESLASRPIRPSAVEDDTHCSDREEEDYQVPEGGAVIYSALMYYASIFRPFWKV